MEMALHWYFLLFPSWLDLPGTNPIPAFFSILLRGPLVPRNCLQSLPALIRILFLSGVVHLGDSQGWLAVSPHDTVYIFKVGTGGNYELGQFLELFGFRDTRRS